MQNLICGFYSQIGITQEKRKFRKICVYFPFILLQACFLSPEWYKSTVRSDDDEKSNRLKIKKSLITLGSVPKKLVSAAVCGEKTEFFSIFLPT